MDTKPGSHWDVSQYMKLREMLTYEQVEQLIGLLHSAIEAGRQYNRDWSVLLHGNEEGYLRRFEVTYVIAAVKPNKAE